MAEGEITRGAIAAALSNPNFVAVASRLTGGFLRNLIANRLKGAGLDLVVIAAEGTGATSPPYRAAEIVWQPCNGGDFEKQAVSWNVAIASMRVMPESSGTMHLIADCEGCGQRNELILDRAGATGLVLCSHCGLRLGMPFGDQSETPFTPQQRPS